MHNNKHNSLSQTDFNSRQMDDMNCIIQATQQEGALYLGNIKVATDHKVLQQHKIGAVLSVCPINNDQQHIMHLILPAQDVDNQDLSQYFENAYNFIEKARKVTSIIIHCQAGISRSTTILISYLVKKYLIGVKEALQLVESKRWQIFPNNGFLKQLAQYEREFFGNLIPNLPPKDHLARFRTDQGLAVPSKDIYDRVNSRQQISIDQTTDKLQSQRDHNVPTQNNKQFNDRMEQRWGPGSMRNKERVEYPRFAQLEKVSSLYGELRNQPSELKYQPIHQSVYLDKRQNNY